MANDIDDKLVGMKQICQFLQVSENTILAWQKKNDLPIRKAGGIWIGSRTKLNEWFKGYGN